MNSSDLTEPYARRVRSSSPTHRSSSPHSSGNDSRRMSPLDARNNNVAPDEDHLPPFNEITPIVSNGSTRRNYQSTEGLRNRDSGFGESQPKNSDQRQTGQPGQQNPLSESAETHVSWYSRIADRYGSLELENKGSVARDHLALERTFLAWLRTSLAFASIGIAITQLFRLNSSSGSTSTAEYSSQALPPLLSPPFYDPTAIRVTATSQRLRSIGKPLGTTFIGVAIVILLIGFHRYFESQYWIIRGKFPASRGSIAIIAFVAAALIIAALVVILAISPGAVEA
ncbi:hypothetical protein ETB97_001402 [Aspergillus alliaceus]|uniref:DUF202 domain-containing protein n=1 Tax=Petromyces alliaceus TaxID=209559 RepID=A0A5N6G838_PETAA|nr:uncharacterized protein BDW43DRAFT_205881 [Aspergillus alliaceus]KAB8237384.1 hypothetical protein BDW43DRAFT_205881 [Aspergillus alliaceus]KAE8391012.1 hypothetical protein BDV23DRAFT_182915 [Aspergillus alliaceus]KAF5860559.1 hypothetical protein ETB97_001402 [Aspergillus burnettii]